MSAAQAAVPTRLLNDGHDLPAVGYGTFPHHGEDSAVATAAALALGYRLLDTALSYGNEDDVGKGIRSSGVDRDAVVVTSKLPGRYHGSSEAWTAARTSLGNLGLERIDLYLIHWPLPRLGKFVDTWKAMIDMREQGLVRSIGVSNFTEKHLSTLIEATGVAPAVNQIEMHPFFPQTDLRRVHEELGIVTQSWSPLGRGTGLLDDPSIIAIADAVGATPAQVVLRWHVEMGSVPIPMSSNVDRQRQNLDLWSFDLAPAHLETLAALGRDRIWGQDPDEYEEF